MPVCKIQAANYGYSVMREMAYEELLKLPEYAGEYGGGRKGQGICAQPDARQGLPAAIVSPPSLQDLTNAPLLPAGCTVVDIAVDLGATPIKACQAVSRGGCLAAWGAAAPLRLLASLPRGRARDSRSLPAASLPAAAPSSPAPQPNSRRACFPLILPPAWPPTAG